MNLSHLLNQRTSSFPHENQEAMLLDGLKRLTEHHRSLCSGYRNILQATNYTQSKCHTLEEIPFIPVNLFKNLELHSIRCPEDIVTILASSSTSGQKPSQIFLDKETSKRQSQGLTQSLKPVIGDKRLPMLIIDTPSSIKTKPLTARGAGVLGLMRFGHSYCFALDDDHNLNLDLLEHFLEEHAKQPFLIFGFTFMAWMYFLQKCPPHTNLKNGILIHSGGWKKMQEQSVSPDEFKSAFFSKTNLSKCYNFYGMVEQIGSIYLEGSDGILYPPVFSDVIIRDPFTLVPLPPGEEGLIQLLSLLPLSYPGHSILTSDMGILRQGVHGRGIEVTRRAPKAEVRGCSDTHVFGIRK
ncbi:acyl-protein synthetase [Kiloniella antarctica]|uniref:Acyl-protein synthetase n=1 Tax=Kiloniella antarctica TaxID=1550907 RepID=A0ABW5BSU0_9PROT